MSAWYVINVRQRSVNYGPRAESSLWVILIQPAERFADQ